MLAQLRAAWRCDCDGVSHLRTERGRGEPTQAIAGLKAHIKELTGYAPESCPWRAMYDPLVDAVLRVANLADAHVAAIELGPHPAAIIVDGLRVYLNAKAATRGYYLEKDRKEREAKRGRA